VSTPVKSPEEVRTILQQLSASVWQLSVLSAAVEAGLVEPLAEPRAIAWLAERAGCSPLMVERTLDVLVAMGLVQRDGDRYVAGPGLAAQLEPQRHDSLKHEIRATLGQSSALVRGARTASFTGGWTHTDPDMLVAQGKSGGGGMDLMVKRLLPTLDGLEERLQRPGGAFLDVGSGVSQISIEFCRWYPSLRAVGLEPADAPAAEAARNIAGAGLADRVEVRRQLVQELRDVDAYDLAWIPQPFLPKEAYQIALRNVFRALRPGGWLLTLTFASQGADLAGAMARLRTTLWGGEAIPLDEFERIIAEVGYNPVRPGPVPPEMTVRPFVAQRPR
jgi:SAM-dependent methyltransferase